MGDMTEPTDEQQAYPGYATAAFRYIDSEWFVIARPWNERVGVVAKAAASWTAVDLRGHPIGLYPDQQAAGEALVKHAGYEVLR
jgi:hypothetical protein